MVRDLEQDIAALRSERSRHALAARRVVGDIEQLRGRWYSTDPTDALDLSEKRTHLREEFHAVFVLPGGKGRSSSTLTCSASYGVSEPARRSW